jgi:tRNA 2-thiouridine synthesizing protein E
MGSISVGNKDIGLSDDGFIMDSSQWNDNVAQKLASLEGLDSLDLEQLTIIRAMREHYDQYKSFPILASICKHVGSKSRDCVARKFRNPMLAWKLAGLPKPSNIFFTSFDGERYIPNPFY